MQPYVVVLVCVLVILFFSLLIMLLSRYRRCPSDKIMVIYGNVGSNKDGTARTARCVHGGAAFIWPVVQAYRYLDLTPISISVDLKSALSKQNIRIDVPSRFTVGISTEQGIMQNAAERLLGLKLSEVQELAKDIIVGQLRLVIATMDIEEINTDRDKFLEAVSRNVETELRKIGLRLINVNVTDINDESGYIVALGREAAAQAINDAKRSVAEKDRDGTIGEANAVRDQRVQVSAANATAVQGENNARVEITRSEALRLQLEAEARAKAENEAKIAIAERDRDGNIGQAQALREQRVAVAAANAVAVQGENDAKIEIARSDSNRREKEAEALKLAMAAEAVQAAKANEEAYEAKRKAETVRAELERATQQADIVVKAEILKKQAEIDAEAQAEVVRRYAKGEADAIFAKMEAQAKGTKEILTRQAEGLARIVESAGGDPSSALRLMLADKMEQLMRIQVDAIKNIKFDKVTVWDGGASGKENKTATAGFLSGLMKSLPPLNELFEMTGMKLPEFLGKSTDEPDPVIAAETKDILPKEEIAEVE